MWWLFKNPIDLQEHVDLQEKHIALLKKENAFLERVGYLQEKHGIPTDEAGREYYFAIIDLMVKAQ